jgi:hypothetical protein
MSGLDESGLPPPSPWAAIIAAALLEHEQDCPGFIERTRVRMESQSNTSAAVRLRGPRAEPAIRDAVEQGLRWMAILAPVAELEVPPVKRRRWGFL